MPDPARLPAGVTIDAVDWLPSGARSGLVRVRGRREASAGFELPALLVDGRRFASLPDPRADRDPEGWRGAYVVDSALAAEATAWALEWPGGASVALPPPAVPAPAGTTAAAPAPEPVEGPGGEVVERAVLAERRARRAEAAEQAQARIAREALRAVEVLELRAGEVEERLGQAQAERDALQERLGDAAPAPGDVESGLREELIALRAELARREAEPPPVAAPAEPVSPLEADRRAERLRSALTATVTAVAELRMQLHEAQVARRTREVAWSAEAVRLAVLEREHAEQREMLAAVRAELEGARAAEAHARRALDEARAAVSGAEAAHEETRRRFTERVLELREARERIATLEAEVAAVRAEGERAAAEAAQAARTAAEAEAAVRIEEAESTAAAQIAAAEEAAALAQGRLAHALASIDEAETAREVAEARAVAAEAARRAAEVARAAGAGDPFAAARERLRASVAPPEPENRAAAPATPPAPSATPAAPPAVPPAAAVAPAPAPVPPAPPVAAVPPAPAPAPPPSTAAAAPAVPGPPPAPPEVVEGGALQARAAAEAERTQDTAERERIVADLAAAADEVRRRATIVPAAGEPPGDLARGRAGREYPLLRGAIVKLAHDDPVAAARLIAGLLPAQHVLLEEPVDYDLTVRELGTFAVSAGAGGAAVAPVLAPRGRKRAAFHVVTDALTLAEWLAGVGGRPRRFRGPTRVTGSSRQLRALEPLRGSGLPLDRAVRAGAALDPALAVRCLSYAVHPSWTAGSAFEADLEVGDARMRLVVGDGGGLDVRSDGGDREPDARLRLTAAGFTALLADEATTSVIDVEGDQRVVELLHDWFDRARGRA